MKYWDKAWSLVEGCTPCIPGCDHCWAARWAHRFNMSGMTDQAGRFAGKIRTRVDRLDIPTRRQKPTVYAIWNDLFHEDVPDGFIRSTFNAMTDRDAQHHTFLILTKRPERMAAAVSGKWNDTPNIIRYHMPRVWHGLTVCNQEEADAKLAPWNCHIDGNKFLSIEPMLGSIDLDDADPEWWISTGINAVILGGETGPGARPMHPDWVRSVRDQCAKVGMPFLLKQWGEYIPRPTPVRYSDSKMPPLPFRPGCADPYPLGWVEKGKGRLLDGRTHDDMPWRKSQ